MIWKFSSDLGGDIDILEMKTAKRVPHCCRTVTAQNRLLVSLWRHFVDFSPGSGEEKLVSVLPYLGWIFPLCYTDPQTVPEVLTDWCKVHKQIKRTVHALWHFNQDTGEGSKRILGRQCFYFIFVLKWWIYYYTAIKRKEWFKEILRMCH